MGIPWCIYVLLLLPCVLTFFHNLTSFFFMICFVSKSYNKKYS
nr:MAG TPA: hypothetical protein [Caudoviricetes sp.]